MEPIAQHKLLRLSNDHSVPSSYRSSLDIIIYLVFSQSNRDNATINSFKISYNALFSVFSRISLTGLPVSSSITIKTFLYLFFFITLVYYFKILMLLLIL